MSDSEPDRVSVRTWRVTSTALTWQRDWRSSALARSLAPEAQLHSDGGGSRTKYLGPAPLLSFLGGSVAEWLACWTQAQKGRRVQIAAATLSGNSLRQTVHTHRASVHQAAKLVAALFKGCGGNCRPAESNGSLLPGL